MKTKLTILYSRPTRAALLTCALTIGQSGSSLAASTECEQQSDKSAESILFESPPPRRLTGLVDATWPSTYQWSPDSKRVLFSPLGEKWSSRLNVSSVNTLGDPEVRVLQDKAAYFSLSPDGKKLAFYRDEDRSLNIRNFENGQTQSLQSTGLVFTPTWSPGSTYLFAQFVENHGLAFSPQIINTTNGIRQLVEDPLTWSYWPAEQVAWSPSGSYLYIFTTYRHGVADPISPRWTESAVTGFGWKTSASKRVTFGSSRDVQFADDGRVAMSPDGQRLAFTSSRDGDRDIYVTDASSDQEDNEVKVSFNDVPDGAPEWSPDGRLLAWESQRRGNYDIYVADPTRPNHVLNLTDHPADDRAPKWSPDGRMLAFTSDRDGPADETADRKQRIYLITAPEKEPLC